LRELEKKERRQGSCWSRKPKCVLSSAEVLGGAETNRRMRKEDEFHELVGLLKFWFVPRRPVLEMHPPIELHRHRGRIPNNGIIYELVLYTGQVSLLKSFFSWCK